MIKEGDLPLDPRSRILRDPKYLITDKRARGYRPILMMDANNEWLDTGSNEFQSFVDEMNLVDPLHQKFGNNEMTSTTYSRGRCRIDFILVDSVIVPAIDRIGTRGLHKGIISDHAMLYIDCNEDQLFSGIINRPVLNPSR